MISKETIDYFMEDSDRWIRVWRENGKVIGINFVQGHDYEHFHNTLLNRCKVNIELTDFYNNLKRDFVSTLDFKEEIDKVIWCYVNLKLMTSF